MPTLHLRLAVLRAERRLSQRQLAALAGVRPDTVSALERGTAGCIRFDTLANLCEALNCEPGDLLEVRTDAHNVPLLGGADEDDLIRARLRDPGRRVDGASFLRELVQSSSRSSYAATRPAWPTVTSSSRRRPGTFSNSPDTTSSFSTPSSRSTSPQSSGTLWGPAPPMKGDLAHVRAYPIRGDAHEDDQHEQGPPGRPQA